MKKTKIVIDKLLLSLAGISLFIMVMLSIYQVAVRFILNTPSTMSEEIVRFLLIWFALLSTSYVFGIKNHIAILFIVEKFRPSIQRCIDCMINIVIIMMAVVLMIWGGLEVVKLTYSQIAPSTGWSMAIMYSALPVSGCFVIFYAIYNLMYFKVPDKTTDVQRGEHI